MRRFALLVSALLVACGRTPDEGERVARGASAFTSTQAVLVELELEGAVGVDTPDLTEVRGLIATQLMYTVGALYADRSAGRVSRAEISDIAFRSDGVATYHARLPVAWGGASIPASYDLVLPRNARRADQSAFVAKYGATCIDPEAGPPPIDVSRAFLFFRPRLPGCVLDPADVSTVKAQVRRSAAPATPDRYPEYDRIWEDRALDVVVLFSRADAVARTGADDEGLRSYEQFEKTLGDYLKTLDPSARVGDDASAALGDGRNVRVHTRLVAHDLSGDKTFDAWYNEHSGDADVIVYNGHAGLGGNVRSLMSKGRFKTGKYLLWAVNACDSFAYVERTLADWRAALNPDDPSGTKYMDVLSNVLAGYFKDGPATSMTLVRALVEPPVTYRQILARLDPAALAAVTGDEDNTYTPPPAPSASEPTSAALPAPGDWSSPAPDDEEPTAPEEEPAAAARSPGGSPLELPGCGMTRPTTSSWSGLALIVAAVALLRRRRCEAHAAS